MNFAKLLAFLWRHRQEVIEVEEVIRRIITDAKAAKAA